MGLHVSAIIPVRDGAAQLPALLTNLAGQTLPRDRFEVVVVDNASRDATAAIAREAGAVVAHEPVPNRSRARNRGAATARADLFAFTDVDCVPEPTWLEAMVRCADRAPLVAGPVRITTTDHPNAVERFEALWRFSQEAWVKEGWAATANLAVHRAAFEALGGLDPSYRHIGEDVDFCIRAGRAGLRLGFCPEAVVTHAAEDQVTALLRRAFFHGYSSNQARRRIGVGQEAWRHPLPVVRGNAAMAQIGMAPGALERAEWTRMSSLARLAYGARMLGSAWATLRRAR